MRKYIIRDLQQCDFCSWTWEEPQTRTEILKRFRGFASDEGIEGGKYFNLGLIAEIWHIEICPVDIPIVPCPDCRCPMHKKHCPECDKQWEKQ